MTPQEVIRAACDVLTGPLGNTYCAATAIWTVIDEPMSYGVVVEASAIALEAGAILADTACINFDPNAGNLWEVWSPIYRWNDSLTPEQVLDTMRAAAS